MQARKTEAAGYFNLIWQKFARERCAQGTNQNKSKTWSLASQNHNLIEKTATVTRNNSVHQNSGERSSRRTHTQHLEKSQTVLFCPCLKPRSTLFRVAPYAIWPSLLHQSCLIPPSLANSSSTTLALFWEIRTSSLARALARSCLLFGVSVPNSFHAWYLP